MCVSINYRLGARARARRTHPAAAAEQKGEKRREGERESEGGNVLERGESRCGVAVLERNDR